MINDQLRRFNHQLGIFYWSWNDSKWGQTKFNRRKKHGFRLLLNENRTFKRFRIRILHLSFFQSHFSTFPHRHNRWKKKMKKSWFKLSAKKNVVNNINLCNPIKKRSSGSYFHMALRMQYTYKWQFEPAHHAHWSNVAKVLLWINDVECWNIFSTKKKENLKKKISENHKSLWIAFIGKIIKSKKENWVKIQPADRNVHMQLTDSFEFLLIPKTTNKTHTSYPMDTV